MKSILGNTRKPDITFYSNGRIDITAGVVRQLGLSLGDVIDVMTDSEEYYLYVKYRTPIGRHEASVYPTGKNSHNFRTYSQSLCRAIYSECKACEEPKLKLCCGEAIQQSDGKILLPIITKNIL